MMFVLPSYRVSWRISRMDKDTQYGEVSVTAGLDYQNDVTTLTRILLANGATEIHIEQEYYSDDPEQEMKDDAGN